MHRFLVPSLAATCWLATLVATASPTSAQSLTFRDLAEDASEVPGELRRFAGALFERCEEGRNSQRARCRRHRRRDIRALRAARWLVSVPAMGHVELGPYETVREGFAVRVPDFEMQAQGGVLSTRVPTARGRFDRQILAEKFFVVPPESASRWFARNDIERLRLRFVFRFGRTWEHDGRRGALIEVAAFQVYNASTGSVLLDSAREEEVPPGPPDLDGRVVLWDPSRVQEARWRAPNGEAILFSVEVEPGTEGDRTLLLQESRGVDRREVASFDAPCCDASLAAVARGQLGVLVIFTETRPDAEHIGRGAVHLFAWRDGRLHERARWTGTNRETPPAWVTDPNAQVPSSSQRLPSSSPRPASP